ncbi:hypothetical protein EJB05_24216, partial [Eragrostis curvula]
MKPSALSPPASVAAMEAKKGTEGSAPPPPASAAAISMVLGNDDLLHEILLRLGFPTSLVRAAVVCRRWFRVASNPAFLRRFRDLHPPRLLGFYICHTRGLGWMPIERVPQFVPMLPQPPELAAVLRRSSFSLDAYESLGTGIMNCRNGRVLISLFRPDGRFTNGAYLPLQPTRAMVIVPPLPMKDGEDDTVYKLGRVISKEDENGLSYFWLMMEFNEERKATAFLYRLEDDVWRIHTSATTQLPGLSPNTSNIQLVDDRIYMAGTARSILVLNLTSSSFCTIKLPDGVSFNDGGILLSRANDSGVYLVRLKDLKLCIWLHRAINDSVGGWMLFDTICLRDMCADLKMPKRTVNIIEVGDNAEFVFLEMGKSILYLDVKSKVLHKVYNSSNGGLHKHDASSARQTKDDQ